MVREGDGQWGRESRTHVSNILDPKLGDGFIGVDFSLMHTHMCYIYSCVCVLHNKIFTCGPICLILRNQKFPKRTHMCMHIKTYIQGCSLQLHL